MPGPISSEDGVTAAVPRAITFLSGRCFSGKCGWARTSRISAPARPQNRRVLRQLELLLLQDHLEEEQVQEPRRRHRQEDQLPLRLLRSKVQVLLL